MEPFEILAAPYTVWLAPTGEAFPAVTTAPGANWVRLGSSGDENYGDDGVSVQHTQSIETWRGQSVAPVKAWRTEEGLVVGFTLHDISAAQYARILDDATVTQTAAGVGTPGTDAFPLSRGDQVKVWALLARGLSPGGDDFVAQYQVPVVFQQAEPEPTYQKGEPAGLACEFMALKDPNAASTRERFGKLVIQTAASG